MKAALKYAESNPLIVGAVLLGAVAVAWIAARGAKGMGQDIGGAVVDALGGVVSGAGSAVVDAANDPGVNPLQPFGAWLGGTLFDLTHPGQPAYLPSPLPVATGAQNSAASIESTLYNTPGASQPGVAYDPYRAPVFRTYGAGWVTG